jgi:hypothetical protein
VGLAAGAQRVEERGSTRVAAPPGGVGHLRRGRRVGRRLGLHAGVTRRDGEPQNVDHVAGVAVGHRAGQHRDLGAEHGFRGDHFREEGELLPVVALGHPLGQEPVDLLTGEPHPHPRARHGDVVELLGHQIVEGPVEVRERHVDVHAGDRQ